jgi:CubicO group peptidase (beta-lactamase class C family)
MRSSIGRFVGCVCLVLACAASRAAGQALDEVVAETVKPFLEKKKHATLAIGVLTPEGKRDFGFGTFTLDGKDQQPDEHTLYEIGSITKIFTSTLLAQLVLEKKIKLDDPVQPWLPAEWKLPRRDDRDITFLHLATHTSGLPVQPPGLVLFVLLGGAVEDPYGRFDSPALAKSLENIQLPRPIGSRHEYSNLGVGLLGHALARVDGADSYEALLAKRILRPLGMEETSIRLSDEQKKKLAPGHDGFGKQTSGWNFATLEACGGIRSNAGDMLRFLEAAMAKTDTSLQPAFAFAQQPWRELNVKGVEIGLCWMRSNSGPGVLLWHNGGTGGYASFMGFRQKSGIGVVILCNGAERAVDELGAKIIEALEKRKG